MTLVRSLLAEGIGAAILAATVVGSGIMAQGMAQGNDAMALLANTGATVAALAVLIALLGPVSGAHFNPAVSLAMAIRRYRSWRDMAAYAVVQFAGAAAGTVLAHVMFSQSLIQISAHRRSGTGVLVSEAVATTGLLLVILGCPRKADAPWMVPAWIGAAYWFTSSTSFANPAMAVARSMSDTFAGIRPMDVPAFVVAELAGVALALLLAQVLFQPLPRDGR